MHPLLFELSFGSFGVLRVPAFGALLAAAFGFGLVVTLRLAERAGLPRQEAFGACLLALFAGVLGARVGFVVLHPSEVGSLAAAFSLQNGGLSGSVGLAVGTATLVWQALRRGLAAALLLDAGAPGFALGVALARVGCWLEGCDFGKPLAPSAPTWLARLGAFPTGSPVWATQVAAHALLPSAAFSLPVHPSELYEAAGALGVVVVACFLLARQRRAGTTALTVFGSYAVLRVLVDLTRPPSADVWCARAVLLLTLGVTALVQWPRVSARRP
jgi:phosphatidylglycerol---prolipoprotein diacylglyceryl transferase